MSLVRAWVEEVPRGAPSIHAAERRGEEEKRRRGEEEKRSRRENNSTWMTPLCNDASTHGLLGWKSSPFTRLDLVSNLVSWRVWRRERRRPEVRSNTLCWYNHRRQIRGRRTTGRKNAVIARVREPRFARGEELLPTGIARDGNVPWCWILFNAMLGMTQWENRP